MKYNFMRFKVAEVEKVLLFLWWLNSYFSSVMNIGALNLLVFISLSVMLIYISDNNGVILTVACYFVPFTSQIASPMMTLALLTFLSSVLRGNYFSIKLFKSLILIILFFIFSIFNSVIIFDVALTESGVVEYLKSILLILLLLPSFSKMLHSKEKIAEVSKCLCYFAAAAIFISFTQYLLKESSYLYQDFINSRDDVFLRKLFLSSVSDVRRVLWVGVDPNFFMIPFVFFFGLSLYFSQENIKFYLISILIALSVLGTYSRTGFILILLTTLMVVVSEKKLKLLFMVSLVSIVSISWFSSSYIDRVSSILENLTTSGGSGRFELLKLSFNIFRDNPFGVGIGQLENYGTSSFVYHFSSHNTYLEILVSSGIFLFLLYLFWQTIFIINLWINSKFYLGNSTVIYAYLVTLLGFATVPAASLNFILIISLISFTLVSAKNSPLRID